MSRSFGSSRFTTRPPILTSPAVTASSPATRRRKVDLPQPEGPSTTIISPSATATETPLSTSVRAKLLRRSLTATSAMRHLLLLALDQAVDEPALRQDDHGDRRQHGQDHDRHHDRPVDR